jgi:hypothetical protein
MRHVLFFLLLGFSTLVALVLAFPFLMTECNLYITQAAIDQCFDRSARAFKVYSLTAVATFALSILLHFRSRRWGWFAAIGVCVLPWPMISLIAQIWWPDMPSQ